MGGPTKRHRTTISVPRDLKAEMDAAEAVNEINWSAIACRAFRAYLKELDRAPTRVLEAVEAVASLTGHEIEALRKLIERRRE